MPACGNQVDVAVACPVPPGQAPAPSRFPAEGRSDACNIMGSQGARAARLLLWMLPAGLLAPIALPCVALWAELAVASSASLPWDEGTAGGRLQVRRAHGARGCVLLVWTEVQVHHP